MRSDLLSKRIFIAGCLGLPWLWTVHALYHWKGCRSGSEEEETASSNNEGGLLNNPEDRTSVYCRAVYYPIILLLWMEGWTQSRNS